MSIVRKVKAVEKLFKELEQELNAFREQSGLYCISGCGACCKKPDIEATVLEFLPFAFYLYQQNKAFEFLEKLGKNNPIPPVCLIFNTMSVAGLDTGSCSEYQHRGLICRLFGFSASRDKNGQAVLVTCKYIKAEQQEQYQNAVKDIREGRYVPVISNYYARLANIDMNLTRHFYPVNKAIKIAIETVLIYYTYRRKRSA